MPVTIPPFVQYQSPMTPLRGLWNRPPAEGDYLITCECDWLVSPPGSAVQFSVSGNSPVALSQIVALAVDNSLCGADVQFIFSDSGFKLTVPAHDQLVAPVFTNALTFIASAPNSIIGDTTVFQILNSMPPPVPIAPSVAQNHASVTGINANVNASTVVVPAPASGTLNAFAITADLQAGATAGTVNLSLVDGGSHTVWQTVLTCPSNADVNVPINVSGMSMRFQGGLNLVVATSTVAAGYISINVYYSAP